MQDKYNAFLYRDENASSGEGVLAGVTVGVKANIAVKGMPFHAGIGSLESRIAAEDAEVVTLLKDAGASIAGILNMEEAALGSKTDNPHFGATINPHKEGYSPGGSSGGSGAAVAAGLCDIALGTDTMGSVRIPASHCGVYGFKPATKSVSQVGLDPADLDLDAIGVLARSLDQLEAASCVISRFEGRAVNKAGATLIGHGVAIDAEVEMAFDQALATLATSPALAQIRYKNSRIRFAGFIKVAKALTEHLEGVQASDHLAKLLKYGPKRADQDWEEDQRVLSQTREDVREIVAKHGFLIMPTVPNPPFPHSENEPPAQADFTCLANIAGLPAIGIPMGWTKDGLPLGVQLVGEIGEEASLFQIARHIDDKLGAYRPPTP